MMPFGAQALDSMIKYARRCGLRQRFLFMFFCQPACVRRDFPDEAAGHVADYPEDRVEVME